MIDTGVTFEADGHRYFRDGREQVAATHVIEALRLGPPYPVDRGQMEFGTACHKASEFAMWGRLDEPNTSPVLMPYVRGVMVKAQEMRIRPIHTELRIWHPEGYAGTLDLFCEVYGTDLAVIDYKTGQPPNCVELQLALYVEGLAALIRAGIIKHPAWPKNYQKDVRRFSMQLLPERAVVRECRDEYDFAAALGAVRVYKWKYERRKGI